MTIGRGDAVATSVRRLFGEGTASGLGDGQLLDRLACRRDEVALEAIIASHGPMVLAVCRRVLRDPHDVEDAFQATFLILVRRASTLRDPGALGRWLHEVAHRVALRIRADASRRRARERKGHDALAVDVPADRDGRELSAAIDEEILRLPASYRAPVVLCLLEGRTYEEAAGRLAWSVGMVRGRLARARQLLRRRLTRRGLAPGLGLLAMTMAGKKAVGAVPTPLASSTIRGALGGAAAVAASGKALEYAGGLMRAMFFRKVALTCSALLTMGALVVGAAAVLAPSAARDAAAGGDDPRAARGDREAAVIDAPTRKSIDAGLEWLAGRQGEDGSFGKAPYQTGITGLAGLAMLASGSEPGRGPYGERIDRALKYLESQQVPTGYYGGKGAAGTMYSQAFATEFVAEAFGASRRDDLRMPLERAVRLIVESQGDDGGWRYLPEKANAGDLSVTACQYSALKAARLAGIEVPDGAFDKAIAFLLEMQDPDGGFRYLKQEGPSNPARSSAGLWVLLGERPDGAKAIDAAFDYLDREAKAKNPDTGGPFESYALYYASNARWLRGGDAWRVWYAKASGRLVRGQNSDHFWPDPISNEYATAMALLVLQKPDDRLAVFRRAARKP